MGRVWSRLAILAVAASLIAVLSAGCKPKVGAKCDVGQAGCPTIGGNTELVCTTGTFSEIPCRGPLGCVMDTSTKKVACDDSTAEEGDACLTQDTSSDACTVDHKQMVQCVDGKFKAFRQCRGPKLCTVKGENITCDVSLQLVGDPCSTLGTAVCTPDHKQRLVCKDNLWAIDRYCRGAKGCSTESGSAGSTLVDCDETIASLNDPCGVPGYTACADDGKNELVCQGGKFVEKRACPKLGCHILANTQARECQ